MSTISVIVPVYNAENYIEQQINNLINQTHHDLEIILVNNGSADNSGKICDRWAAVDSRVKVVHKTHGSVSSAKNAGLDVATGKYITFADTGYLIDTDAMEVFAAEMEANQLDLLVCGYRTKEDSPAGGVHMDCNMFTRYEYKENISSYITTKAGFHSVSNKIYSAYIIQLHNLRFDESVSVNEDILFNCRYFTLSHRIKCIPYTLCCNIPQGTASVSECRTGYIEYGKKLSQAIIDATQSKGLYSNAAEAINIFYRNMLHTHLMFILYPDKIIPDSQKIHCLKELFASRDNFILENHLAALPGVKNKMFYLIYKLHQPHILIRFNNFINK